VGILGGTTIIQTIFDLVPRCLKHVWCYRIHSVLYAGVHVLKAVDLNLADNVLHITPQEIIQWRLNLCDLEGQAIDPLLPIHLPSISLSR
jgi:hypothetical protein